MGTNYFKRGKLGFLFLIIMFLCLSTFLFAGETGEKPTVVKDKATVTAKDGDRTVKPDKAKVAKDEEEAVKETGKEEAETDEAGEAAESRAKEKAEKSAETQEMLMEFKPDMFSVSLQKGSAATSIPIAVPAGMPQLSLSYSSETVNNNSTTLFEAYKRWSIRPQASWIGLGWNIGGIPCITGWGDGYIGNSLSLGDKSGTLEMNWNHSWQFYLRNSFLKIQKKDNIWTVIDADGTRYEFGNTENSRKISARYNNGWELVTTAWYVSKITDKLGNCTEFSYHKVSVSASGVGTYTQAFYPETIKYYPAGSTTVLHQIEFNRSFFDRQDYPKGYYSNEDTDWDKVYYSGTSEDHPFSYKKKRLDNIVIKSRENGVLTKQKTYTFGYDYSIPGYYDGYSDDGYGADYYLTLKNVRVYNRDSWVSSPPLEFSYEVHGNLTKVRNGIGGEVEYQYSSAMQTNPVLVPTGIPLGYYRAYVVSARIVRDGMGNETAICYYYSDPKFDYVPQQLQGDGFFGFQTVAEGGAGYVRVYTFENQRGFSFYSGMDALNFTLKNEKTYSADADPIATSTDVWQQDFSQYTYGGYGTNHTWEFTKPGAEQIRVHFWSYAINGYQDYTDIYDSTSQIAYHWPGESTDYSSSDFNSVIADGDYIKVYVNGDGGVDEGPVSKGCEINYIEYMNTDGPKKDIYTHTGGAVNKLFSETAYTYNKRDASQVYGNGNVAFLDQVDTYLYEGNATPKTHQQVKYEYDYYGNVTKVSNMGDLLDDVSGDEIYTFTEYLNDEDGDWVYGIPYDWVLGVPYHNYVKDASGNTIAENWNYFSGTYNGSITYNNKDCNSYLRKTETAAVFGSRGNGANPTMEMDYDQWGNIVTTRNALGNAVTTIYDNVFHLFPVSSTNALGHTSYTYYYGVNGNEDGAFQGNGLLGQVKSIKDINGKFVRSTYDNFGRPVAAWGENFSEAYPAISYEYAFWNGPASPNKMVTKTREQAGGTKTFNAYAYFDGMGRQLQTQSPSDEAGKMMVSGPFEYDALGRVVKGWMGYRTSSTGAFIPLANLTKYPAADRPTESVFDEFGRVSKVISPDFTESIVVYDGYQTTAVDAEGKQVRTTMDAFGRQTTKELFTGTYPNATVYTTTKHEYDAAGRLVKTIEDFGGANNETTYQYDNFGHRTNMVDPDMGTWFYAYDKLGRMTSQTDAREQTITFSYDVLSRLIKKTYPDGSYVQYDYDTFSGYTGGNSKGRLVRVKKEVQ